MYILHKINFFSLLQNFSFFSLPVFSSNEGDKMEKYFQNSLSYSYYPTYSFSFFHQSGEKIGIKMLSVFLIFIFFSLQPHISPPPPSAGSNLQKIHPCKKSRRITSNQAKFNKRKLIKVEKL